MTLLNGNGKPLTAYAVDWQANWVIEGLWQTRGVNMLCGAPRARKSTLNAYLVVCALTGRPAFDLLPVKPITRAAIFFGEGIPDAEATRFHAAFAGLGLDNSSYKDRITIFGPQFLLRFDPGNDHSALRKELAADGYDFVSFDPLVNFHNQEENTSKMAAVMAQITAFTEFATVSLPHHVAKPSLEGPPKSLSHQARGHGSIAGYTAVNMVLERAGSSDEHTLKTDAKYTEKHGSLKIFLKNGIWTLGEDDIRQRAAEIVQENPSLSQNEVAKKL